MTPTAEQIAILTEAKTTNHNLLISALAGAAKTTTLILIAEALPATAILALAFNKKIAEEMKTRLPANCEVFTLNSLGHRAWGEFIGRPLTLNPKKNYQILQRLISALPRGAQADAWANFADILDAFNRAKTYGYIPPGKYPHADRIPNFHLSLPTPLTHPELLDEALTTSIEAAFLGEIDFNDQIYLSSLFPVPLTHYPVTMVDEAQDLSPLNQLFLRKQVKKRLIAVGDPHQAIYAFRGADTHSFQSLSALFPSVSLPLTTSFRCPVAVVEEARAHAPAMRASPGAAPGSVRTLSTWSASDLPPSSIILCRNNAPLFSISLKLLRDGQPTKNLNGNDNRALLRALKKLGGPDTSTSAAFVTLEARMEKLLPEANDPQILLDQAECLRTILSLASTIGGATHHLETMFEATGPITLSTGHRAKGLEYPHVFILDRNLIDGKGQAQNLLYVMQTRALESLTYITSGGYRGQGGYGDGKRPESHINPARDA